MSGWHYDALDTEIGILLSVIFVEIEFADFLIWTGPGNIMLQCMGPRLVLLSVPAGPETQKLLHITYHVELILVSIMLKFNLLLLICD